MTTNDILVIPPTNLSELMCLKLDSNWRSYIAIEKLQLKDI